MDEPRNRAPLEAHASISARNLARIRQFRLFDDVFMRVCFGYDARCVELVLRIALQKPELAVLSVRTQYELQSLRGTRSLRLDVLARDSEHRLYNLEIQREEVDPERGRTHGAVLDSSFLEAGQPFSRLPEIWIIFIVERDPFKLGLPRYHFVRYMPEINLALNDGSHILYMNGEFQEGETDEARLMHDFSCTDPDEMRFEVLAGVVRHFKQTREGLEAMSAVVEAIREEGKVEGLAEGRIEGLAEGRVEGRAEGAYAEKTATVLQLVRMGGFTEGSIAEITRLSVDEVREIIGKNAG